MKQTERDSAITFRKEGYSYSEILKRVPVARSTLSLWLRSVGLTKRQKQRLTDKKIASIRRGWKAWREKRVSRTKELIQEATREVQSIPIDRHTLLLIGSTLYWAEGSKEKDYRPSQGIVFNNSDPKMIRVFMKWLRDCLGISQDRLVFDIYLHDSHRQRLEEIRSYWARVVKISIEKFDKIYFKRHLVQTKRKNTGAGYFGLLRVRVSKSTDLNRRISGWIEGIYQQCGVV